MSDRKKALEERLTMIDQSIEQAKANFNILLGHRAEIMHQIKETFDAEVKGVEDAAS